jgi:hypothetical protein
MQGFVIRTVIKKDSIDIIRVIKILSVFSFLLYFFITFLRIPLHNYDFWWHLATGKFIVETKSLPQEDPFSYTSSDTFSARKKVISRGNWLAEVIFYKVYALWEFKGMIILRSLLLLLFLFSVFLTIRKQNASSLIALIFTAGVFWVSRSKTAFLIPGLVMLLSNMHPGYIVCIMLVFLYLAGEIFRCILVRDSQNNIMKGLIVIFILTVIFSVLNPNGATMLTHIFSLHGEHIQGIVEYQPTFFLYLNRLTPIVYSYIAFLALSLLSLIYQRKIGIIHILVLVVFTIMSFVAYRYVIFYMCVSAPILARTIINIRDEKIFKKINFAPKFNKVVLHLVAFIIGIYLVFNSIPAFAIYSFKADTTYNVPEGAADFLSNVKIKGNMINEYSFGGYLIWRLYPEKKVFIDGRLLEVDVYEEYQAVAFASESPKRSWQDIIRRYDVSYIVFPPIQYQGTIFPIVEKLLESEDWVLIYMDHQSFIFIRNNSETMPIIKEFAIDKMKGLNTIIIQSIIRAKRNPVNPYFYISLGKVFLKLGRIDDAEKAFVMAYQRAPNNTEIKKWLKKIIYYKEKYDMKGNL